MSRLYDRFEQFATAFTQRKYWKIYLAALCCVYCVFSHIPGYKVLTTGQTRNVALWNRINRQIDQPFTPDFSNAPGSHEAKLTFRLTAPLVAKLFPTENKLHRLTGLFILQNILGFFFFYLLILFAETYFKNRTFSFLLPWCFAVLYTGKTFFYDTQFFFDGMAYFFLLLSIFSRKPLIVFASLLLAFYTDERALIGSGFVLLFHILYNQKGEANRALIASIISSVLVYFALRFYMQWQLGMVTPITELGPVYILSQTAISYIFLGIFTSFKAFWIIFLLGVFFIKGFWPRAIYLVTLLCIILGGISVFDFSRSIAYGFTGILAVLFYLHKKRQENIENLNKLLLLLFSISFFIPIYVTFGSEIGLNSSIIGKLLSIIS